MCKTLDEPKARPDVGCTELLGCPFCGRDTGCYHESFEITHKSMGFDKPRIQAVVYCHDCGAMAPTAVWYMRQPNAGVGPRHGSDVGSNPLLGSCREIANNAIYFADNSDYRSALWEICSLLGMDDDAIGDKFMEPNTEVRR